MNWDELEPEIRALIDTELTVLQAQAFVLALYGLNLSQISRAMSIKPQSAKTYLDAAIRKLVDADVHFHPNGEPYMRDSQ